MPWRATTTKTAILVKVKVSSDDLYTSVHIEKYESKARQTKLGPEEITREIPTWLRRASAPALP